MKTNIKRGVLFVILALMVIVQVHGGQTPRHIARIVEMLPCSLPDEGTFLCPQLGIDQPLYIERRGDAITQIGVRLFSAEVRHELDAVVCNAVERLSLELLLCGNVQKQKRLLKEYRTSYVYNGFTLGTAQFSVLDDALEVISGKASTFSLNVDMGKIILRAKSGDDALVITLPADRELLFAYDKKEHEDLLYEDLKAWDMPCIPPALPDRDDLQLADDGIYTTFGTSYMIDSLNDETFYTVSNDKVSVLFQKNESSRSLQNMLMGLVPMKNVALNVRCHTYERAEKFYEVSLDTFLGYMQHCGMKFYSATYRSDHGVMQGLLLMHHPVYDYVHMLIVKENLSIFSDVPVVLQGDFYSFIPQYNIKSLFNF